MDVKESEDSFTGFLFGNSLKALETLENVIRVLLIVCWVVAALPFGGASLKMRMSSFFATCFSCLLLIHIPAGAATFPLPTLLTIVLAAHRTRRTDVLRAARVPLPLHRVCQLPYGHRRFRRAT